MKLKIKKVDYIIALILVIATVFSLTWFLLLSKPGKDAQVYIYIDNQLVKDAPYKLSENRNIPFSAEEYPVLLADLQVSIKDNKVAVTYEKSPRNYCSNIGYINLVNFPIVCLPNKTLVVIRDDAGSFYV